MSRYREIAETLVRRMRDGELVVGERLPGVRRLARAHGVSVSTAVAAVQHLEDRGWLESRPRSGFYVRRRVRSGLALTPSAPPDAPVPVTSQGITLDVIRASDRDGVLQLGTAVPHMELYPVDLVRKALRTAARSSARSLDYAFPPGLMELREQVARRLADAGCPVSADRVVITAGAQEATMIALRATTQPGDVVAVESPCYYGLLQVLESLSLEALEIPTDPVTGISLPALELALDRWPIRACALMSIASNPTGYVMSIDDRQRLVQLLAQRRVPLIEDDVYGELGPREGGLRPVAARHFDHADTGFLCGSASKTVAPALRVGWLLAPVALQSRIEYLKYAGSLSASALNQLALAEIYAHQGIERHLRRVRATYSESVERLSSLVLAAFPEGTAVSRPAAGFVVWIRMPEGFNAVSLYQQARTEGIIVAPGIIFSASGRYENCLRINAAMPWGPELERAIVRLGQIAIRTGA